MYALRAMVDEERSQDEWQEYTAMMLWSIGAVLGRNHWKFPSYLELKHPEKRDNRTPEQIKQHILARLTE